ncbi:MAG: hypothetical protein A2534_02775 [Candidatus Magasanikbacteria bacterium RIFOXYD2_FULL_39_9]|uniref:Uncharacterized protein n=1 Tax=Candidatus Magasanikbacteria bacterium RIFOXYD1_FULL_40_23 TaxID=1798705 RepID=A0A1F6P808_9BACT|nr:MAG: hypothetical protein A2563_00750 [Candidatus Magasanikbacteria bacterium RIFOXYD1_FULL_40_23]OGH92176.1 MAG: hypothetical protein A2534_02775 [Candidatus Magasanikbacteria bacterium RIFOXYD2_FULL_39_9]
MPTVSKKQIYIAIAAALFIIVLYFVFRNKDGASENQTGNLPGMESQDSFATSTSSTSPATTAPKKSITPTKTTQPPLSATQRYLDAIRMYKNVGYYFQFVDCHGLPGTITLKKGKKFMLDNRDPESHKIAIVGGQSFTIGAYNFAIATAPSTAGTHYITCDGGGAAAIVVQQ